MKTKEEIILHNIGLKMMLEKYDLYNDVLEAMEKYAQQQIKLLNIPVVSKQSEQSNCVHSYEHILTVKTLKYKCKYCGDEKWEQLD